jgi:hypothetical protein
MERGELRCYVVERRRVAFVARFIHNGIFGTLFTCFVEVNGLVGFVRLESEIARSTSGDTE